MVTEVNAAEIESVIVESTAVVLKATAPWCAACKAISPVLEKLSVEYEGVKFVEINADANMDYIMEMGIRSLPTFVFFKEGKSVATVKSPTESVLKQNIDAIKA